MSASTQPARPIGIHAGLLIIGVILLVIGVALSYLALTRRWGYYAGTPPDP